MMKRRDKKKRTPRISLPKEVKTYVFQRDRYQCQSCVKTEQETSLEVDHIIPIANGGSNDISNLQTLCRHCNQQKKHHFDRRFRRQFSYTISKKLGYSLSPFLLSTVHCPLSCCAFKLGISGDRDGRTTGFFSGLVLLFKCVTAYPLFSGYPLSTI